MSAAIQRDAYAEAGAAYRYSLTRLHRELPREQAESLDVPARPSAMAVAVHGIVAGAYLASWSKRRDGLRWPLHAIAEAMGLDPVADSEGGKLEPGNGERGKQLRRRIRVALLELEARGALRIEWNEQRRTLYARIELPLAPPVWCDPTYRRVEVEGSVSAALPSGGASASPQGEQDAPSRGSEALPLTEKNEKNEQTDEQPPGSEGANGAPSVRPSVKIHEEQDPTPNASGDIPPGPERLAGNGWNGSAVPRAERRHVEALAAALPDRVARAHPHDREHLAASMLNHGGKQHAATLATLVTYLDVGAAGEVGAHLEAAAARWNGEARSLAGFVLTWLSDLPPEPRHRPEEYRYGFPLRDAMKACGLAGDWGLLRASTFAMAAEAVLDGGHNPERDADGFAASLAATVLQLVEPDDYEVPGVDPSTLELERLAGDARSVPFVLPPTAPEEAPERGLQALRWIGLGYPDPRTKQAATTAGGWR